MQRPSTQISQNMASEEWRKRQKTNEGKVFLSIFSKLSVLFPQMKKKQPEKTQSPVP